jgi:HTH-type transcriptional regulator/antitoxin HigA
MNIKPIKTENDYEATLERIEALFDAKPDTQKGDGNFDYVGLCL